VGDAVDDLTNAALAVPPTFTLPVSPANTPFNAGVPLKVALVVRS